MKRSIPLLFGILLLSCSHDNSRFDECFKQLNTYSLSSEPTSDLSIFSCRIHPDKPDAFLTFKHHDTLFVYDEGIERITYKISLAQVKDLTYRDHLVYKPDSVFILSLSNDNEMYISLLNENGDVYKRWNVSKSASSAFPGYFYIDSRYFHPMIIKGNELYFNASYRLKAGVKIDKSIPTQMILNLSTDSAFQFGDLPDEYKQGDFYGNHQRDYSRLINNKGQLVFSFPISHDIYIYDKEGELLQTNNCKSNFIAGFETIEEMKNDGDLSAIIDAYAYNARYLDLVYDKYNNRYFRIALHKLEKYDEGGSINDYRLRRWSILVLDENFNILEEVLMPENIFMTRLIPTAQGLILQPIIENNQNELRTYNYQACIN